MVPIWLLMEVDEGGAEGGAACDAIGLVTAVKVMDDVVVTHYMYIGGG